MANASYQVTTLAGRKKKSREETGNGEFEIQNLIAIKCSSLVSLINTRIVMTVIRTKPTCTPLGRKNPEMTVDGPFDPITSAHGRCACCDVPYDKDWV